MEPNTELDQEFSSPEAQATSWDEVRRAIEDAQLFWISPCEPMAVPMSRRSAPSGCKKLSTSVLAQRSRKRSTCAPIPTPTLTTGSNTWAEGLDVVVEGQADRVTDHAMLQRLADAWSRKWDGSWQYEVGHGVFKHEAGEAIVFAVGPAKVLSLDKRTGAASRHRFPVR